MGERSRETGMVPGGSGGSLSLTGQACQREMVREGPAKNKGDTIIVAGRVQNRDRRCRGKILPQNVADQPFIRDVASQLSLHVMTLFPTVTIASPPPTEALPGQSPRHRDDARRRRRLL